MCFFMEWFKKIFNRKTFYTNKYFIALFVFVIYITIFSQNNLIERLEAIRRKNELIKQKEYYLRLIKEHSEKN